MIAKFPPLPTRRSSLKLAVGGLLLPQGLSRAAFAEGSAAGTTEFGPDMHGLSIFGDLALPPDFAHLPYADPAAPKGGQIVLQISSTSGNQNFSHLQHAQRLHPERRRRGRHGT